MKAPAFKLPAFVMVLNFNRHWPYFGLHERLTILLVISESSIFFNVL